MKPLVLLMLALFLLGCESKRTEVQHDAAVEPSPNASILPAALSSAAARAQHRDAGPVGIPADSAGRLILPEAGLPPPRTLREDETLARDTLTPRDGVGVTLEAHFKWFDVPAPPSLPEANLNALKDLQAALLPTVTIDLGAVGRMRFTLTSSVFPLPQNTELKSRADAYGHILAWPDGSSYRVLVPGALRAMFSERRVDVSPLVQPRIGERGKGGLLGFATERVLVSTPMGKLLLDQARPGGLGPSAALLCRLLVELVSAEPATHVCEDELVPLRAEYSWAEGGKLLFEVTTLTRRPDLPYGLLFVPPAAAQPRLGELPPASTGVLLSRDELVGVRNKAVPGPSSKDAPGEGLLAVNRTDSLRYVLLDGVAIAWVPAHSERYIIGPLQGRYSISWRDFFGAALEPQKTVQLPARVVVGRAEAAAP